MNTNEQIMAWMMDTYSMHERHTVTAVVTGKPLDARRLAGTASRRPGAGVMLICREAASACAA